MKGFNETLRAECKSKSSLVCLGLDLDMGEIPSGVGPASFIQKVAAYNQDLVCAYKLNFASYLRYGKAGLEVMTDTVRYLHHITPTTPVIGDAKVCDVPHMAAAWAETLFDTWGFDAVTVNPWGGMDTLKPFYERQDKGVFVWCHGSNDGSGEVQDLMVHKWGDAEPLYLEIIRLVRSVNNGNMGIVMGATYPSQIAEARAAGYNIPMLIPGVGAQGGDWKSSVQWGTDSNGESAIINVGRSVLYASKEADYLQASQAHLMAYVVAANDIAKAKRTGVLR